MYKEMLIGLIMQRIIADDDLTVELFATLDPTYDDVYIKAMEVTEEVNEVAAQGIVKLLQDGTHQLQMTLDDEGTLTVGVVTPV